MHKERRRSGAHVKSSTFSGAFTKALKRIIIFVLFLMKDLRSNQRLWEAPYRLYFLCFIVVYIIN